jgi:hypothetical protein
VRCASVASYGLKLFLVHRFLSPWWWRRYVPPKHRFLQEPHGVTSQEMVFFIVTAMKTPNLTIPLMSNKMMTLLSTLLFTCLAFVFLVSVSLDFPCTTHCFFPKSLSNHCQGLHHTLPTLSQNVMHTHCSIHCEITSGQIQLQTKGHKQSACPLAAWSCEHWLPRSANTTIYCCSALVQLLYRAYHESRKLWIAVHISLELIKVTTKWTM